MRSFVPILKKSTLVASTLAQMAALGISIMAPTSTLWDMLIFEPRNSSLHSSSNAIARRNSSKPEIIGNMIFMLPTVLARRMARNCVLKMSTFSRQKRIARQPRNGFNSSVISTVPGANLSPPTSNVRIISGCGRTRSATFR